MERVVFFIGSAFMGAALSYVIVSAYISDDALFRGAIVLAGSFGLGLIAAEVREAVKSFL